MILSNHNRKERMIWMFVKLIVAQHCMAFLTFMLPEDRFYLLSMDKLADNRRDVLECIVGAIYIRCTSIFLRDTPNDYFGTNLNV